MEYFKMKTMFHTLRNKAMISIAMMSLLFAGCTKDEPKEYVLAKEHIKVNATADSFTVKVGQLFRPTVESVSDKGLAYQWDLDGQQIANTKNLEYMFDIAGEYTLQLQVSQDALNITYKFHVSVLFGETPPPTEGATAYITKVLDFMPAVGQFTNKLPKYEQDDTQETMNQKVLAAIGNNNKGMISLGGFGGYVVVGFDHTIQNVAGKRDFRVLANAFSANANPDPNAPEGGSCEAGIIQVAYDVNKNGLPDDNEWYEIAGSAHEDPTKEAWYQKALNNGNDVNTYPNYQITYYRPAKEPASAEKMKTYIRWKDNQGNEGYKEKNIYHEQPYFPLWLAKDSITFKGTRLPQNGIDESKQGNYFILYKFLYGYADNATNTSDESAIDISWAVNSKGQKVNLPGVDFIKIYTAVNQENGWLGEVSTEIIGIEDLHILNISINTK